MNPQLTADLGAFLFEHYKRALDELSEYKSVQSNLTAIAIILHKNYSGIVTDDDLKECIRLMTDEQLSSCIDGVIYFNIMKKYPREALYFVDQIHLFSEKEKWKVAETNKFLDELSEIDGNIVEDNKFKDLKNEIWNFPDFD
ncbi:MAG: hypothetical protein ACLFST_14830 [Spirochaetia bacterium]